MHLKKKKCLASFATQEYLSQGPGSNPFVMEPLRRTAACVLVSVREEMLNPDGLQLVDTGGLIIEKNVGEPNSFCWTIHWPSSLPTVLQFLLAHPKHFPPFFSVSSISDELRPLSPFAVVLNKIFLALFNITKFFCFEIHHSFFLVIRIFICLFLNQMFGLYCERTHSLLAGILVQDLERSPIGMCCHWCRFTADFFMSERNAEMWLPDQLQEFTVCFARVWWS